MDDRERRADVKVGLFVSSALAILITGSLWIAGTSVLGARRVSFRVLMNHSAGLQAGDRVRIAGVSVGRIRNVSLRPQDAWPVVFDVSLKSDVPIRADSTARIVTEGLLGSSALQIDAGSPDAPLLPPGAEILGRSSESLDATLERVAAISEKATVIMDRTTELLERLNAGVTPVLARLEAIVSEETTADVRGTLSALHDVSEEIGPRIVPLLDRLEAVATHLDRSAEILPGAAEHLAALVADVRAAVGPGGARLSGLFDSAEDGLDSAGDALGVLAENRDEIEATLTDLREVAANLRALSREVKQHPFRLVRAKTEPDRRPGDDAKGSRP